MKLYSYYRSSAAYRVRIALNLKGVDHETVPVNLVSGEQRDPAYRCVNTQGLVPTLELEDGRRISQSLAICEWLEATVPSTALVPGEAFEASRVRSCVLAVACDIHPLNNLRVLAWLDGELDVRDERRDRWYRHWVEEGFAAIESVIEPGPFCFGSEPTLADVFLVPQVYNARRFRVDLTAFPGIRSVAETCENIESFVHAHPDNQPDAPAG